MRNLNFQLHENLRPEFYFLILFIFLGLLVGVLGRRVKAKTTFPYKLKCHVSKISLKIFPMTPILKVTVKVFISNLQLSIYICVFPFCQLNLNSCAKKSLSLLEYQI